MFNQEQQSIEQQIRAFITAKGLNISDFQWNPIPFAGHWGIATPFFQIAAQEAKQSGKPVNVQQRAQELAEEARAVLGTPSGFERTEAVKGYLNLYFSTSEYARRVVDAVLDQGRDFGRGAPKGEKVMIEYFNANTHKTYHVGHLRNAILGAALCHISEFAGHEVVRCTYIGDIGLHVIKWLWNYLKHHNGEEPGEDRTRWIGDLYVEADRYYEDPDVQAEVKELFGRWDRQDPELFALWKKTRQWSIEGFEQVSETLDTKFDRLYFESDVEEPGKAYVQEMIKRGIAEDERPDGPVIVRIDELLGIKGEKYRVLVVLRSDGTSLYSTKDLALTAMKFNEYNLARSIYVVDVRQSLYLQQIFKTLELMGHEDWSKRCLHLAYEIVNLPGNVTMSSRDGTVVLLDPLIIEATQRAQKIVEEKNPTLTEDQKTSISKAVALGALKYSMLSRDNAKIVTFDWESALDFNGQAAPYIQYAHVRANSILRRMDGVVPLSILPEYELHATEVELVDMISRLPREVQKASTEYRPLHIANLAYDLARAFNDFYAQCPVLQAETTVRDFRLRLVAAARQAIANSLALLGISAPEIM